MDKTPNYENYTDAQLLDARAHIDGERYPANFAALQNELQRRSLQWPSSKIESFGLSWLYGWLIGVATGLVAGHIIFLIWTSYLQSTGKNPYSHDDWGYGWIGIMIPSVLLCSFIGFVIGVRPRENR